MKQEKSRQKIAHMFDQIAEQYDRGNRLLSLGQDRRWRQRMRRYLPTSDHPCIVDLACGTGDQIGAFTGINARFIGLDISVEMLKIARKKFSHVKNIEWMLGSALATPLDDAVADLVTISFGIRNVSDPQRCLTEMARLLKPGKKALILEFSHVKQGWLRPLIDLYLHKIVPWLGERLTKRRDAYTYLPETIETFPCGEDFIAMMEKAGFINCQQETMNFKAVSLYSGEKPQP